MSKKTHQHGNLSAEATLSSEHFSVVPVSPGRSPKQGNLTGPARKVKDASADWHNLLDKWQTCNAKGSTLMGELANIKLEAIFARQQAEEDRDVNDQQISDYPVAMEGPCQKLTECYKYMENLVKKMEAVTAMLQGVSNLERYKSDQSFCEEPLFQTWPTEQFYNTSEKLLTIYKKELELKGELVKSVAHTKTREELMMFSACWLHQPYIENSAQLLLESMLQETGHR